MTETTSTTTSQATSMRTHLCGELRPEHIGATVSVCGWVGRRREHGEHLAFVDLRDHSGIVQCVINDDVDVRSEYVLRITGVVRERPEGTVNDNLPTGQVELGECRVDVLRRADPPPFPIDARADDVDENIRLQHRYLDLRRERMQKNLRVRAAVNAAVRSAMVRQGFVEVETPMLVPSTPEGAREFLVPSRKEPGSFYALPQSPQLFKQLLMVGGVDRYYQMARCLRDEDLRADRQYEFMQLDMEMSFVNQDDVLDAVSEAVLDAAEAATGERPQPIERITWHEAMDRYGIDKPDLRFGLELVELTPVFASTEFKAFAGAGAIKGIRVPGAAAEYGRNQLDKLTDRAKALGAKGLVWLKVTEVGGGSEGSGFDSPVAKFLSTDEAAAVRSAMSADEGDLILIVADEWATTCDVLGTLRNDIGRPPVHEGPYRYVWVVEFPLFVGVDKESGRPKPGHHPFTTPHPDDLDKIETDPLSVRSIAYDLVLNGWELGSGSIRIHEPELQRRVFKALGISDEEADRKFGFFLNPFDYGAPPHGGFAFGLDRLVAILAGEENIREVIAFPKTQSGQDPMTNSPIPGDPKASPNSVSRCCHRPPDHRLTGSAAASWPAGAALSG
jgi:aspartyl-tRNA synthetase